MTSRPVTYRDLPASAFPFKIEYLDANTGEVLHTEVVTGPGVLEVPPLGRMHGCPIRTRVSYADGRVAEA